MRRFLLPLIASIALPTAANAESVWLVLRWRVSKAGGLEKIEMKSIEQCELMGAKWTAAKRTKGENFYGEQGTVFGYECINGK